MLKVDVLLRVSAISFSAWSSEMFRDLMFSGRRASSFLVLACLLSFGMANPTMAILDKQGKIQPYDVRIIVDISGSMKETDPNNLRIPAVNLLLELMPEKAQAGIWTFGRYVNNLVPVAMVDDVWRKEAKKSAINISSVGLQSNLSGALNDAAWGLGSDTGYQQSVILLTDGKLDMAKSGSPEADQINSAERKKLMTAVLDKYRAAGANIHTLALSDLADKNLLQEIALETGGLYSEAENADELMKAFLRAFDQAVPSEQVPMEDNTFVIDNSVKEFTALIFKPKRGAQDTALLTPSGDRLTEKEHPSSVRWHKSVSFDLITIKAPEAGTWVAEADLDPSNRVTILSDLALNVTGISATIFSGDKLDLQISLINEGDVVDNADILRLTDVTMKVVTSSGREGSKILSNPENPPTDGIYREGLYRLKEMGQYQVEFIAEGKTFQRKRSFSMTMIQPVEITHQADEVKGVYRIKVKGLSDNLDVEKSRVIAKIKSPDENSIIQSVSYDKTAQAWVIEVEETKGPGEYQVDLNVRGVTQSGKKFKVKPEGIVFNLPIPKLSPAELASESDFTYGKEAANDESSNDEAADDAESGAGVGAEISTEGTEGTKEPDMANNATEDSAEESAEDSAKEKTEPETEKPAEVDGIAPKIEENPVTEVMPVEEALEGDEGLGWWVYLLIALLNLGIIGAGVWWFFLRKPKDAVDAETNLDAKGTITDLEDLEDDFAGDFDSLDEVDEEEITFPDEPASTAAVGGAEKKESEGFDEDFSIDPDDVDTDDDSWGEFDSDNEAQNTTGVVDDGSGDTTKDSSGEDNKPKQD